MSVLTFPRIHFGGTCLIHQPTGNGNAAGNIDFTRNHVYRDGRRVGPKEDVEGFYRYWAELGGRFDETGQPHPEGAFSSAAGRDYIGNSRMLWNVEVSGCETELGSGTDDPLVGRRVDLWGHFNEYIGTTFNQPKVVELDSTSTWTRQVYGGQFCLGRTRSSVDEPYLINGMTTGAQVARFHKGRHYIDLAPHWNAAEIGRADLFQFVIERQGLIALENSINSRCLGLLRRALAEDPVVSGLVVQFCLFNASSPVSVNTPTICSLMGTLGLWYESVEMRTFPAGRVLVPVCEGESGRARARAPITIRLSERGVSLNAGLGVPFRGRGRAAVGGPLHPPGEPAVDADWLVLAAGSGQPLARVPRTRFESEAFLSRGGIVDAPYLEHVDRARIGELTEQDIVVAEYAASGQLTPLYEERPVVVEADTGAVYLDVPDVEAGVYFDEAIMVRSYVRGRPAPVCDIELEVVPNPRVYAFQTAAFSEQRDRGPALLFAWREGAGGFEESPVFSTDALGRASIALRGRRSGSARVVLVAGARDRDLLRQTRGLDPFERYDAEDRRGVWANVGALNVRVLPDDWSIYRQAGESPDYDFMYEHVLQFYELLYPFMNREVFSLADGAKCRAHAILNWQMCDPVNRDKSYYMPPTRELSHAKATLFRRFVASASRIGRVPARPRGGKGVR